MPDSQLDAPARFTGSFTQQEPLPQASLDAAMAVLSNSRLHRYNLVPGEVGEVAALEAETAAWQGRRYCLAVTSGGQAIQIALRAAGAGPGKTVLTNAFTLAPVPGAITATGARPHLVETGEDLKIDLADLRDKAVASGARFLLVSHMRGHLCDMDAVMELAAEHGITVIEDCAHSMGARWNGVRSGNHGHVSCFSTQTYKHMNSGEGGFLLTDDAEVAARATILSGSYMHHGRHGAGPDTEAFAEAALTMPNLSARMDALRAAILRPQLPLVDANVARWNALQDALVGELKGANRIAIPRPDPRELRVASSFQFRLPDLDTDGCAEVVRRARGTGG